MVAAAAAAAASLQSCLTLCDPRDNSPPGSPIPGIFQARTLEWVAISLFMWLVYVIMFLTLKEKKKTLKYSYIYLSEHSLFLFFFKDVNALNQLEKEL